MTKKASLHALTPSPRPEIALREAAEALATVCSMIDDGGLDPRSATVKALFDEAKGGLAISVDGAIDFKRGLDQEEAKAEAVIKFWRARKQMIKDMREAFDEKLIQTMTEHPDLPYRGDVEGFSVRNNPPAVQLAWEGKDLTDEMIDFYGIPTTFVRTKVRYEVDKTAVAAHLKSGGKLDWAVLVRGQKVETK
jgi:hypothetical protein